MTVFDMAATLSLDAGGFVSSLGKAAATGQSFASRLTGTVNGALKSTQQQISATTVALGQLIAKAAEWTFTNAKSLASTGWNYNKQMENYTTNFEVMLGSADAAQKKIKELSEFAASTPFSMDNLAGATQTLLAFGVQAGLSTTKLKMLGDISLGNADKMQRLATAYGKATATGKVTGEVVQSMVDAGFNPLLVLSEKTGESMESLQKRMSEGKVSIQELDRALIYATSAGGRFYQGMERAAKTTAGLESTLADNWTVFLATLTKPFNNVYSKTILPVLLKAMDKLNGYLEDNADSLERFEGKLGDWATRSIEGIISAFEWITTHGQETSAALGLIGTALGTIYSVTHPVQAGILAVAAGARYITTRWSGVGEWFGEQWEKIEKAAVKAWGDEKSGIKGVLTSLWNMMNGKGERKPKTIEELMSGSGKPKTIKELMVGDTESEHSLSDFASVIGEVAGKVGELAKSAAGFVGDELEKFFSYLSENKDNLVTIAGNIGGIALQVGELAGKTVGFVWGELEKFFTTLSENTGNIADASDDIEALAKRIGDLAGNIGDLGKEIAGFAGDKLNGFLDYLLGNHEDITGAISGIVSVLEALWTALSPIVGFTWDTLKGFFDYILSEDNPIAKGIKAISDALALLDFNNLKETLKDIVKSLEFIFGIKIPTASSKDIATVENGYIASRLWWDIYANRREFGAASQYTESDEQAAYNVIDSYMGPGFAARLKQYMDNLMLNSGSMDGLFSDLEIPIEMFQEQLDGAELTISPESILDTNAIQESLNSQNYSIAVHAYLESLTGIPNSGVLPPLPDIPIPDGTFLTQGSHASGFYRVPYNDYHTILHRDEAVLTRQQADEWRAGNTGGQQDMTSLVNALARSVASMLRGISVNIDGEAAGELLLPYVNAGLGRIAEERRYY